MASPEELTPLLPETLPDDFGDWDSEASPASLPVNTGEWEAWAAAHPFSETPKPPGQSADRDRTKASLADRPRVSGSASSAPVVVKQQIDFSGGDRDASPKAKPVNSREEWEAWIESHSDDTQAIFSFLSNLLPEVYSWPDRSAIRGHAA